MLKQLAIKTPLEAALAYLAQCQDATGCWRGDYGGPQFLLPMYVMTCYILDLEIAVETRNEMIRYCRSHQNPDGGYGLHIEGDSEVFTSVLVYVAMRLLGVVAEDSQLMRARSWFQAQGGPKASASWGKFVLALLNLYDYAGFNPTPPELWLLPKFLPFHPSRLWCHCRMVYLPMAYLYARRIKVPVTPLIAALRTELYSEPYDQINWRASRLQVAKTDNYKPFSFLFRIVNKILLGYERIHSKKLREHALAHILEQIRSEDVNTNYICLGPINKLFNTLIWHYAIPSGAEVKAHIARLKDYLYHAADGIKMNGYNSSELWDTAFAAQAIMATPNAKKYLLTLHKAYQFIDQQQVLENIVDGERYYRHRSKGGWPFSTREHGWPISDCTAEGLKSALLVSPLVENPIALPRLLDAVDTILSFQNKDGGWATYECIRGPRWLELLNPSNCFGDIMIEYSYVECTSACIQALTQFHQHYSDLRANEIKRAILRGKDFILKIQRRDGSWEGAWGVCFTYGAWFGVWGLLAAGLPVEHPAIIQACTFLLSKQLADGGWGETVESCRQHRYVHAESSQVVMTSWALLALIRAGYAQTKAVKDGISFLERKQTAEGSWPPERIAGVFNKTCGIHYDNYLKIFPLWALALYQEITSQ